MSSTFNSHRSRYGYHPCNFEIYRKLKFLHKHYWIALRQFHTWHRWYRKQTQNRIGPEPTYCPVFVKNEAWIKPVIRDGEPGSKIYPRKVVDHSIIDLFQQARMPQANEVEPFSPEIRENIESLYSLVQEFLSNKSQE